MTFMRLLGVRLGVMFPPKTPLLGLNPCMVAENYLWSMFFSVESSVQSTGTTPPNPTIFFENNFWQGRMGRAGVLWASWPFSGV